MSESGASASTRVQHTSEEPLFARLRELLAAEGIDPDRAAVAALFPDDTDMEFGVVVTTDRRVVEFDLHYGPGDLSLLQEGALHYFDVRGIAVRSSSSSRARAGRCSARIPDLW